jgi:hypothetical protein
LLPLPLPLVLWYLDLPPSDGGCLSAAWLLFYSCATGLRLVQGYNNRSGLKLIASPARNPLGILEEKNLKIGGSYRWYLQCHHHFALLMRDALN